MPVWNLDVDGVLNAPRPGWGGAPVRRHVSVPGGTLRLTWEPKLISRIRALHTAGVVEVRWASTWYPFATMLEDLWQLPRLGRTWDSDPSPDDVWEAKVHAARGVLAAGRRLVWTDDDLDPVEVPPDLHAAVSARRALLIRPESSRGLRPADVKRIEQFVQAGQVSEGVAVRGR